MHKTKIISAAFIAAIVLCTPLASSAAVVVTAVETGGNVVFSGGGMINLNGLNQIFNDNFDNGYLDSFQGIYQGAGAGALTSAVIYGDASFSGPTSFGTKNAVFKADILSGAFGGIRGGTNLPGVILPAAYASGSSFFGTSTFSNQTFASLGLTPGTYDWVWGSGATSDSYRLIISNSSDVPGPMPLFGAGAAFGWSRKLRRRIGSGSASSSKSEG